MSDAEAPLLERIDTAAGCQQCGAELDHSPSDYFCSEPCAQAWHTHPTGASVWIDIDATSFVDALSRWNAAISQISEAFKTLCNNPGLRRLARYARQRGNGPEALCIDGHAYRRRARRRKS
jgi:predicted amidophosphoribosyltransferase